jgi:zinc protease
MEMSMRRNSLSGNRWLQLGLALIIFGMLPAGEVCGGSIPQVDRRVLPNGLVLVISPDHSLPFVTLRFIADAGAKHDPPNQAGLSNITAEGLLLGTPGRTAKQINERIDFLGASLSVSGGPDFTAVDFRVLKDKWVDGIDIFLDMMTRPTFPEMEIQRRIRSVQSALVQQEDQPGIVAQKAFQKALFQYAPYGHAVEGTIESLEKIAMDQVRRFYDRYYRPSRSILVIVGDVKPEDIQQLVKRLSRWENKDLKEEQPGDVFIPSPRDVRIDRPVAQANIVLGHRGIARANPDFYAVSVMNQILGGGGFTSRLMQRVRVEQGLAYSVTSYFDPRKFPGAFQIVLQTQNSSALQAIDIARQEMRRMQQEPVSDQELNTAKNYLIGSFPLRYASQRDLARLLAHIEYHQLGEAYFREYPERIRRIEKEHVLAAARRYLSPEEAVVAMVADMAAASSRP